LAQLFFRVLCALLFSYAHQQLFAWPIAPPMTAMFIGASYANGVIFFASVLAGKKWHRIWAPHVGVFVFATLLLVATFLHWDKFTHNHPVFWIWVFIYVVAPILTPIALLRNWREDPHTRMLETRSSRSVFGSRGSFRGDFLAVAIYTFINPAWLIPFWPWKQPH